MKYVLVLVLALVLGALAYQQLSVTRTPAGDRLPTVAAAPGPLRAAATPASTAGDDAVAVITASRLPGQAELAAGSIPAAAAELELLIPVAGKPRSELVDTFTDARSEGRSHDAIDIMAVAGTPVLAVADGEVEKLFHSERGGLTLYQFEPTGKYAYYYAHLQRYAPGLAEKQAVRRGQVIGYVGSSGNASAEAPHLHFAVFVLGPERRWWEGTAINPYPLLRAGQ